MLSVLPWLTDSDYTLGIFWPLCCLFLYDIQILITPLVSFGHCVVCSSMIYRFWLPPWYLLAIVLSVLLWYTDSDYPLGIFWPLCCLFFYGIQILITPLVSFGHCVVCSSMIYRLWLPPWYLLAIALSVLLWYTDSDYPLGIFWPLCCLFFYDIQILITPLVSFGHCVVCSSMIYRFCLSPCYLLAIVLSVLLWFTDSDYTLGIFWPLCRLFFYDIQILITPWYRLAIVLSVLLWYTDSHYPLGIFWPLCCLFLYDIQILITPLVSFGHFVVCSSMIYRLWLPSWYLLAIVLSVLLWYRFLLPPWYILAIVLSVLLWYTDSDYTLGIFWPLCFLFFYDIQILITPLVYVGHCVVCSSMIYRFWLPPWYPLAIVLSDLLWYTDSDYPLVSFGHCVVCSSMIYRFWLPLGIFWQLCCLFFYDIQILITPWYLLAIVLSFLLWLTDSDYTLGILCPLCWLFFYDIQILIIPLVSFGHCVVCSSMIYRFWSHPWYLLAIVLSVPLWYTDSDYTLGIFWPLCCLFFYDIQIMITPLVSFGHCVVCSSMIYRFWLPPWYILAIVLSVLLWYTDSDYTLGIFWPLCCLFFYDIQILITPLVYFGHCVVCSSMIYRFWLPLGIFCPLYCLFFYDIQILIIPLVSFVHCVVCSSMIYRFWLHLWYLLAMLLSFLLWYTASDYPLGIFWPLCCLFFYDIHILRIPLVSFGHCVVFSSMIYRFWLHPWYILAIVSSVLLWYTDSDYPLVSFGHCVVCSSMIYRFWLSPWYLLAIVLSFLLWYTDSDYPLGIFCPLCCLFFYDIDSYYPLGIFWPLCCLYFYDIQILITPLVSFGHCVVCSSMINRFWLHPWYMLAIVLSVLLWYTDSDYPLGILWPLCCLIFYDIQILITPWYLLAIVLSFLLWLTDSDYTLGILCPLCCLFFYDIQILIIPLVSFGHCVVCFSMIYRFWLPPWYLLAIVLSVLLWYTDSHYPLGIFWPLCCLFFYDIHILITPLVSFGHCVVCSSMICIFWLPTWYLLAIVLSVLLWVMDSDYTLGIFWPLCFLFFYDIQILITPLVSFGHVFFNDIQILITPLVYFGHCVVCSSMIYRFWLPPWYLLAIMLSVLLWYTDSDYTLGIFLPLCCLFFYDIQILITPLVSFGHCVVCSSISYTFWLHPWDLLAICSSMIYRFWLHPWYLLAIVLSVLLWVANSDYPLVSFGHLFFYDIQILITPLVSFGHCVVCSSMIYRFWLSPWYLLAIVLSFLLWFTDSDYTLGIFWPLCCLFFYDIQILITPLVYFGHCVVCSSMIYRFWLPPWYPLAIVLSDLLWYTDSDYPLVSFGHCFVCSSMIYRFWLPLGIFWQLCCLFFYD